MISITNEMSDDQNKYEDVKTEQTNLLNLFVDQQ